MRVASTEILVQLDHESAAHIIKAVCCGLEVFDPLFHLGKKEIQGTMWFSCVIAST